MLDIWETSVERQANAGKPKTVGALVTDYFIESYIDNDYGNQYYPTTADRACAKKMGEQYGIVISKCMVDKFFYLKRLKVGDFARASITMSVMFFHRNELLRTIKETANIPEKDDNEF